MGDDRMEPYYESLLGRPKKILIAGRSVGKSTTMIGSTIEESAITILGDRGIIYFKPLPANAILTIPYS